MHIKQLREAVKPPLIVYHKTDQFFFSSTAGAGAAAALAAAMESCELIVTNAANDTLAVEATITGGLRGFWYVLYGSDDLASWVAVADGTYVSGTPAAQAAKE